MKQFRDFFGLFVALFMTICLLAACGGGGGGGGGEQPPADTTPPSLGLQTASLATQAAEQTIAGTVEAGATVVVTTNTTAQAGQVVFTSATAWQCVVSGLVEGENNLTVKGTDAAGNTTIKTVTITRDTTAPTVSIAQLTTPTAQRSQAIGGAVEAGAAVAVAVEPAGATIVGAVTISGGGWSCSLSNLADGTYTVTVTATDAAGNAATASAPITIDATAPALALDPFATPSRSTSLTLTGTVDAQSTVTVAVGTAATVGAVTFPSQTTWQCLITNLPEGVSNITVTAVDNLDNDATATAAITVDLTAPAVTVTNPQNNATEVPVDALITATFSEPVDGGTLDVTSFVLTDTNGDPVAGTVSYEAALRKAVFAPALALEVGGTYTATITSAIADLAGNTLAQEVTWSFDTTTDVAPPPPPPF